MIIVLSFSFSNVFSIRKLVIVFIHLYFCCEKIMSKVTILETLVQTAHVKVEWECCIIFIIPLFVDFKFLKLNISDCKTSVFYWAC